MGIPQVIGRQAQRPAGLVGRLLLRYMTAKTIAHTHWTVDLLDLRSGDHVLEIGFGSGASIQQIASRVPEGHVAGVDISETAVQTASKRNREAIQRGRVKLRVGDGASLPFGADRFDKVCTINTMYVIAEPPRTFREMYRVLKPGGMAAVTFPVRETFMKFPPAARTPGFHFHELPELRSAFEQAGFQGVRLERNDAVPFGGDSILGTK